MKRRPLFRGGPEVSTLGLGTVKLGRDQGVKYPAAFQLPDDASARALLDLAWDLGINFIDTAPAYGRSEERLGQLLQGDSREWVIGSKAGEEFEGGASFHDFSPEHIRSSVERSLGRLRRESLDLVLLHSNGDDTEILNRSGAPGVLLDLKAEGKIRGWGMSSKTVAGGKRAVEMGADVVMIMYNPWHPEEAPILDAAYEAGCGVLIKKALNSGHGASAVEDSFRFILGHPGLTSIVVGTIHPGHLKSNAEIIDRLEGGS